MTPKAKRRVALLAAATAVLCTLYASHSYISIFESRKAFLYHPESDRLFELELGFKPDNWNIWKPLNPFTSLRYIDPEFAKTTGTLRELIAHYRSERQQFANDRKGYLSDRMAALSEELEADIETIEGGNLGVGAEELWDVSWFFRQRDGPVSQLQEALSDWAPTQSLERTRIDIVDIVLVSIDEQNHKPPKIESLTETLLLRGAIVRELDDLVSGFPAREMREAEKRKP